MSNVQISREAVDKAARQIHTRFDDAAAIEQARAREVAMDALNAAAPLIVAAAYERRARQIHAELQEEFEDLGPIQGPAAEEAMDQAKTLRRLAAELRGA